MLIGHLFLFLEEMSIQILCPFLIGLSYYWAVYVFYKQAIIINMIWKYGLPFHGQSFHVPESVHWNRKAFNFYKMQFI